MDLTKASDSVKWRNDKKRFKNWLSEEVGKYFFHKGITVWVVDARET